MARSNKNLNAAKRAKKDEFYTQLSDIENELRHYKEHFEGKTVFCNCDDPYESNFFKYFALNFNHLKLKKLIATCYSGSPIAGTQFSLFDELSETIRTPYKAVVTTVHDTTGEGGVDMFDVAELFRNGENKIEKLNGNGDFRSEECIELLKEADIVVTNPPFSLFNEYINQLIKYNKYFLVIGPKNAITYKEIFSEIKQNKMWMGFGFNSGNAYFKVIDGSESDYAKGVYNPDTGLVKFRNCSWFTNLDFKERHDFLPLYQRYSSEKFPTYDNYPAIEVSRVAEIPYDYSGEMGVPITFIDRFCPEQFEIIGSFNNSKLEDKEEEGYVLSKNTPTIINGVEKTWNGPVVNKQPLYKRIVVRHKHPEV